MSTTPSSPRRPRLLAGSLLALAALLAAAWFGLRLAFPPEKLAALLSAEVSRATGRDFAVRGPLSIRLLPRIAIAAADATLANAPWGTRAQMLQVRQAHFDVAPWPLLRGRVEIASARFEGVDLWLETDRTGAGNWVFSPSVRGESAPAPDRPSAPQTAPAPALLLQELDLRDARLSYRDGRSGAAHTLQIETLTLQRDGDGQRIDARLASGAQRLQVAGRTGPLTALADAGTDWPFDLQLKGDGVQASARGQWHGGATPRALQAEFALAVTQAAALAPWVDAKPLPLPAEAKGQLKLQGQALQVDTLQLSLADQSLSGKLSVQTGTPWRVDAEISSASLDLQRWRPSRTAGAAGPAATKGQVFGHAPLALDKLPDAHATLALRVQRLAAPGLPPLTNVDLKLALQPGRLRADPLAFGVAGGQLAGSLEISHAGTAPPQVALRVQGSRLSVDELLRAAGSSGYASGGTLQLRADLQMRGNTPRALAAGANGELMLAVADTTLGRGASPIGTEVLPKVLQALRLEPDLKPSSHIECAVIRLPLRDGVAAVDRSIALETSQLAVAARGEVRLTDETLALAFKPAPKGGLKVNPLDLAQLVVLRGPWADPKLQLDAQGVAGMAAQLGLAGASGGVSLIAQQLLQARPETDACRVAMTGRSAQPAQNTQGASNAPAGSTPAPAALPKGLPDALRRIFK